jgi:hypothetical protein
MFEEEGGEKAGGSQYYLQFNQKIFILTLMVVPVCPGIFSYVEH